MIHKNKNYAFIDLPDFQNGDIIEGNNYSRQVLTEVPQDLVLEDMPNMFNCNLTGNNTGKCANVKKDLCYHLNEDIGLENFPGYQEGDTCGPNVDECRHVIEDRVIKIELQNTTIRVLDDAREDISL